jgi:anti-sigma B factor antagonist
MTSLATTDPSTPAGAALRLGAEMTIAFAAAHRETLVDAVVAAPADLQLDLSAVSEFDSSGVQLLLSARRSLAERGHALQIVAASTPVQDALTLFGLAELLLPPSSATADH